MKRRLLLIATVLVACFVVGNALAEADSSQISIMQDDEKLVDSGPTTMVKTLEAMQQLGVQTVRVNLEWSTVAPAPNARKMPAGFSPNDPNSADYNWSAYDRLAQYAPLFGITVQFNITGPGPLWAMAKGSPTTRAATHWKPNATQFLEFAYAVGARYSGNDGMPRISDWSIWNEPNQPGWLAPQWLKVKGKEIPESPQYYRALVKSGWEGLNDSGHTTKTDTILVGETAPLGDDSGSYYTAMTPLPFLRTLYCVSTADKPLRGTAAKQVGCPTKGSYASFVKANPGLFKATGFAHHPYYFSEPPSAGLADPNDAPLADLSRLETFLNKTFSAYGVHRTIPLYFTEYGFETNPPDPHRHITPAQQAAYLNEADYIAYRNPRVKSVAQFLLYDSPPDPLYRKNQYDYWDTFQTGLLFVSGKPKPSYAAYRMPIWLPTTQVSRAGSSVLVWGQVRPADGESSQTVKIQWSSGSGGFKTLASVRTHAGTGYYTTHVSIPGKGEVRASWTGTDGNASINNAVSGTFLSRDVAVTVK